jgi:pyruvate kinase
MKKANMSQYDHLLSYEPPQASKPHRLTQIIATINDKTTEDDVMNLVQNGMNIAACPIEDVVITKEVSNNFVNVFAKVKKGVDAYNTARCNAMKKKLAPKDQKSFKCIPIYVATALDVKGEFLRTGGFEAEADFAQDTDEIVLCHLPESTPCTNKSINIDYPDLSTLPVGQLVTIFDDQAKVVLKVTNQNGDGTLQARVEQGGKLSATQDGHKVILPGAKVQLTRVIDQVTTLAEVCRQHNIDMIFVPVTDAKTFKQIACMIRADDSPVKIKIIAKLEGQDAVDNVEMIIECADGVMIPRHTLGNAIHAPEQVITYQKIIIAKCMRGGVPSIVAHDMMKGMETPDTGAVGQPTRAELADVFNSVMDGTDCTMFGLKASNTTAIKKTLEVIMEAEEIINFRRLNRELLTQAPVPPKPNHLEDFADTIAIATCTAAMINASNAIVVLTDTGRSIQKIAKFRPQCPIIAISGSESVARQCLLNRGVFSIVFSKEHERCLKVLMKFQFFRRTCVDLPQIRRSSHQNWNRIRQNVCLVRQTARKHRRCFKLEEKGFQN